MSLNAGTASGDARRRYGANPLANAVSNMVSTATSEQAAIASMTEAERTAYFASNPGRGVKRPRHPERGRFQSDHQQRDGKPGEAREL